MSTDPFDDHERVRLQQFEQQRAIMAELARNHSTRIPAERLRALADERRVLERLRKAWQAGPDPLDQSESIRR